MSDIVFDAEGGVKERQGKFVSEPGDCPLCGTPSAATVYVGNGGARYVVNRHLCVACTVTALDKFRQNPEPRKGD